MIKAYSQLLKFRLSFLVAFSSAIGYGLGTSHPTWSNVALIMLAGLLVTGSANTINQVLEIDRDKLMKRTAHRPLPEGRIGAGHALAFAAVIGVVGLTILAWRFNATAAALSLVSLILYAFIYTPLKSVTPLCVAVGAIPGGMPPMIGYVAAQASGIIGVEAWVLFGIQFMWQFPHFWAIAWVLDDDYKAAGFRMLPFDGAKDMRTAFQIMIYTLVLLPVSLLPLLLRMSGSTYAMIAIVCGVLFLAQTFYLMLTCTKKAAMNIMFGSFLYLPIVQIALVFDKI
ncbi:MAG: protoheme IX farnesyltransferase [Hymenobacteraceae bacterium]|nr:protoheme IX farnesyltransferase [Hymenobacteraceae bacterium]